MAVPPEIMAALQGGGGAPMAAPGPPPGGAGGVPPEILAALAGAGQPEPAPTGDPESMYQAAMEAEDDPETLVNWAIQSARKAAHADPDPEDTLIIEKATTALQQYLATLQKQADGLMSGQATPKALRRSGASQGY